MADLTPAVSPTGQVAIPLPQWVKAVVAALAFLAVPVTALTPEYTIAHKVGLLVMGAAASLGVVSEGIRKKPQESESIVPGPPSAVGR